MRRAFRFTDPDCPIETYVRFLPRKTPCPVCGASGIKSVHIENRTSTESLNSYWSTWCDVCEARNAAAAEVRRSVARQALDDLVAETEALGLYHDEPGT